MAPTNQRLSQVEQALEAVLVDLIYRPLRADGFSPDAIARVIHRSVDKITAEMEAE